MDTLSRLSPDGSAWVAFGYLDTTRDPETEELIGYCSLAGWLHANTTGEDVECVQPRNADLQHLEGDALRVYIGRNVRSGRRVEVFAGQAIAFIRLARVDEHPEDNCHKCGQKQTDVRPNTVRIDVQRVDKADDIPLPDYASLGAAGADVHAAIDADVILRPGARAIIPTGFRIAIPPGYEMQIRPRSGLAAKHGLTVLNSPATLDSDYYGAVGVILVNLGIDDYTIRRGDRIAQLIVSPVQRAVFIEVDTLPTSKRGEGGFGSTGYTAQEGAQ